MILRNKNVLPHHYFRYRTAIFEQDECTIFRAFNPDLAEVTIF